MSRFINFCLVPFALVVSSLSQIAQAGKISILTLWFYFIVILLCGILMPLSIYLIRKRLHARAVERKILRFLETDGTILFHDISEKVGCSHRKILEIAKGAITRRRISGTITFDEAGFISETELRRGSFRKDLTLDELVTEISRIESPEVKKSNPQIPADDRPIHSLKIPTPDVAIAGEEIMGNVQPEVKQKTIFTPITKGIREKRVDVEKKKEKKLGIEVVTKEQQAIFRSLNKHRKSIAKARRQK